MRLALLFLAVVSAAAHAQDARSLVRLQVHDRALDDARELRRKKAPKETLAKLKVHQPYTLKLSGVIISANEIVTTALHPQARLVILVTFHNGTTSKAVLIGTDPRSNLALLRVPTRMQHPMRVQKLGVTARQRIRLQGHRAGAVFLSSGMVARPRMAVAIRDFYCVNERRPIKLGSVFMVATPKGKPNPGSVCLDDDGRLAGIVIGSMPPLPASGATANPPAGVYHLTFVVPSERIVRVVNHLRRYKRVIRAYYGVSMLPIDDQVGAHFTKMPESASAVQKVWDKSPAATAGLRRHDIIVRVDGKTYSNPYDMGEAMGDKMPGTGVTLEILRGGKTIEVTIIPTERR